MIKVSVFYPAGENTTFNMDYYCNTHTPMIREKFGAACKGIAIEQGVAGGAPGAPPAFVIVCHLSFDSIADFQTAFAPHAATIMGDIPNYTNIEPIVQISEVIL